MKATKARVEMHGHDNAYPFHDKDGGPWLPTVDHAIMCAKCHTIIKVPDFRILRQARDAHKAAGEDPIDPFKRPPPESIGVADLTVPERKAMAGVVGKRSLSYLSEKNVMSLVGAGLLSLRQEPRGGGHGHHP